jgi:hypothetical protein
MARWSAIRAAVAVSESVERLIELLRFRDRHAAKPQHDT